jgi:hypothetical protein
VLPALPLNEKNSSYHHNSYNKGPNLAFFSFTESPSNSLLAIKLPKNHITSSYTATCPKQQRPIFGHQRALGIKVQRKTHCEKELRKTMARLAKVVLVDGNFYNFLKSN